MTKKVGAQALNFIFTADGFRLDAPDVFSDVDEEGILHRSFAEDRWKALYDLAFSEKRVGETPAFAFLRRLGNVFARTLTNMPELELLREKVAVEIGDEDVASLLGAVPFSLGAEYVDEDWLRQVFTRLNEIFCREIVAYDGAVGLYLAEKNQRLRVPERIFFHLVENKDDDFPFAFMATYATKDDDGNVSHKPLSFALTEYKADKEKLVTLFSCLNKAASDVALIGDLMASGELFHPLKLTDGEAYELLRAVPVLEENGILCRVPNWWRKKYAAVGMTVRLGDENRGLLGFETLVTVVPELTVNGEKLSSSEIAYLLAQSNGLARLKGKWVEVDHDKLNRLLAEMERYRGDLTLMEAMRLETQLSAATAEDAVAVTNGEWLSKVRREMRFPAMAPPAAVPDTVMATLRPYQETGYHWLLRLWEWGFGGCLADDMGLGKTLQTLTFLEKIRRERQDARVLLVVPASLLTNWVKEAEKFTPQLTYALIHGKNRGDGGDVSAFLSITTYGMISRLAWLTEITWDCLILDEAQAIKNPAVKQTRAIKKIPARHRLALTGTPIENDLMNLWSLFDFLNCGLLGSVTEFRRYLAALTARDGDYSALKNLVSPFILRRLKTDRNVIADLPEKDEQSVYVSLTKKQVALYRKQVADLEASLGEKDGMERRGLVLSTIQRLKQICNHPDQYLGQTAFSPDASGKFQMLRVLCETIAEKRERLLVFTQYREIIDALAAFLTDVFGREGLVLHGGTRIKRRGELVEAFNGEAYIPFMVLSLKAGGTGLNLTGANHVIHFDRWWNPAVEDQATDRAFRIGQKRDVIVYKLVSEGTIEEKIDEMIRGKKELAAGIIGGGIDDHLTELSDAELLQLLRLEV